MYTQVVWVNTILNHIDTKMIYLGMKVLAWYIDLNDIKNKYNIRPPYPTSIKKCEFLFIETQLVSKKDNTNPTMVYTLCK